MMNEDNQIPRWFFDSDELSAPTVARRRKAFRKALL